MRATPTQRDFWSLAAMRPGAGNEVVALSVTGALDVDRLSRVLDQLEARLDAWRTRFVLEEDTLVVEVGPPRGARMQVEDVSAAELAARAEALAREPFDLAAGRPIRATLLRAGDERAELVLVAHHAIIDGSSLFVLLPRAIGALYRGEPADLEPFAPWAEAQEEARRGAPGQAARRFWNEVLRDAPPSLSLPTDRPRPATPSLSGRRMGRRVDVDVDVLRALGRPVDFALTALATLLHRMADADDMMVGVTHANRRAEGAETAFGCLVRTLPLRVSPGEASTVGELAAQIHTRRRRAFEHLTDVDELGGDAGGPGHRVILNYMPFSERDAADFGEGLGVRGWRPDPGWTSTDLAFDVIEEADGLRCVLEYDAALFDAETADSWLDAFVTALSAVPAHLDVGLGALPLLGPEARAALGQLGHGGGPASRPARVHDLMELGAAHADRAPALVREDRAMDYRTLWRRAGALADRLGSLPMGAPPRLVGLATREPVDTLVALVGILRAGAAYVPLDPHLPEGRLAQMLEDARPIAVVGDTPREYGAPLLRLDEGESDGPGERGTPSSAAYVIFTSGSTGRPKGVVVAHQNVVHQIEARQAFYGGRPGVTLSAHSYAFDSAVACVFWALVSGDPLVVVDENERRDPALLRACIARHRVETLDVPPALWGEVIAGGVEGLSSLRTVIVGGEALPPALARRHRAALPHARLVNEYGPTETTVFCTAHEVEEISEASVPIGRPIHRTRCRIVDRYGEPVPRGGRGELWIGGAGVTAGYLRDDARTRERFLDDPQLGRAYRTGDKARWDTRGRLRFEGRVDAQVQIRGHRVEPQEVVAALEAIDAVSQALVLPIDGPLGLRLHAWVVPARGATFDPVRLRDALRATLPEPMMPATIDRIGTLPRAASGKVDASQLPPPEAPRAHTDDAARWRTEPRTQAEDAIAKVFRDVLGLQLLDVHASFFDLGGTSLTAVRALSRIHDALGVRVPLSAFVRSPSVAALAEHLHGEGVLAEEPLVVRIREGEGPPLWLLHPVGGHVVYGEEIAKRLDASIPLYGIQARGLDGHQPPLSQMGEIASLYVSLIREAQPEGPYFIAGPSQGGLAALEIAQRLHAAGQDVRLLAMLDCWAPGFPRRTGLGRRVLDHAAAMRARPWTERLGYLREKAERRWKRLEHEVWRYRYRERGDEGAIYDTLLEVQSAYEAAADAYEVRPYPGRVHVFRALRVPVSPGLRFDDPTCGWAAFARGGVEVIDVDAEHKDMLDPPHVERVAEAFERLVTTLRG